MATNIWNRNPSLVILIWIQLVYAYCGLVHVHAGPVSVARRRMNLSQSLENWSADGRGKYSKPNFYRSTAASMEYMAHSTVQRSNRVAVRSRISHPRRQTQPGRRPRLPARHTQPITGFMHRSVHCRLGGRMGASLVHELVSWILSGKIQGSAHTVDALITGGMALGVLTTVQ